MMAAQAHVSPMITECRNSVIAEPVPVLSTHWSMLAADLRYL